MTYDRLYQFTILDIPGLKRTWWLRITSGECLINALLQLSADFRDFVVKKYHLNPSATTDQIVAHALSHKTDDGLSIPGVIMASPVELAKVAFAKLLEHDETYVSRELEVFLNAVNSFEEHNILVSRNSLTWPAFEKSDIAIIPNASKTKFWAFIENERVSGPEFGRHIVSEFPTERAAQDAAERYIVN